MAILSGFEYDIFISYRHNDNRSSWVTEFVNTLQEELSATIKEPISVYFDKNPHDGLLETHNVDKSLQGKLKCLIFVPIISQTYCDTNSFAWQHEFCAFNKLVKDDEFGRDIKLSNGNVASRILPVKIHDVDAEDKLLLESELGDVLRSIEFIYKSAGVNRPLKPNDERTENSNHTYYRDQINKVANAIKEIITGLKNYGSSPRAAIKSATGRLLSTEPAVRLSSSKSLAFALLIGILSVAGYFIFNNTVKGSGTYPASVEKSIAVLPFKNIGKDNSDEYFSDGMTEEVINYLAKVGELNVISRTSIEQYKGQSKDPRTIANELGVSYILTGSVRKAGNTFRISVQLIEAETGFNLWSSEYDKDITDVLQVQSDISKEVTDALKIVLTATERKNIENVGPVELTAYDFYLKARSELMNYRIAGPIRGQEHLKNAFGLFRNSLAADPEFARTHSGIGVAHLYNGDFGVYIDQPSLDSAKRLADKALEIDNQTDEAYYLRGIYYYNYGNSEEAVLNFEKALEINPNYVDVMMILGRINEEINGDYVTGLAQMHQGVQLGRGPELTVNLRALGTAYFWIGLYDKSEEFYKNATLLDKDTADVFFLKSEKERMAHHYEQSLHFINEAFRSDSSNWIYMDQKAWVLSLMGRYQEALKLRLEWKSNYEADPGIMSNRIGYLYWKLGDKKKAHEYFKRAVEHAQTGIQKNQLYAQWKFAYFDLAGVSAFLGEREKAYQYLDEVNKRKVVPFWMITLMKDDPLLESINQDDHFKKILREMENRSLAERDKVAKWLEKELMKTKIEPRL